MDPRILLWAFIIGYAIFFIVRGLRKNSEIISKRKQIKELKKSGTYFICGSVDELGKNKSGDMVVQFYGEAYGGSIRPGMKIEVNGCEYEIKEVYADKEVLDRPSKEIPDGETNTAILIETRNFEWSSLKRSIKSEKLLALKVR